MPEGSKDVSVGQPIAVTVMCHRLLYISLFFVFLLLVGVKVSQMPNIFYVYDCSEYCKLHTEAQLNEKALSMA